MSKNDKKFLFNNAIYNDYKKMQKIFSAFGYGINLVNIGMVITPDILLSMPNLYYYTVPLYVISEFISIGLLLINFKNDSKEIKELKKLYNEFIKSYNKLNKVFDFNDPIQIYVMYNYLLYKGYLSINKNFEFTKEYAKDIKNLYGSEIITGHGVCRHISSMLVDIYNDYGIKSAKLSVYVSDKIVCNKSEFKNYMYSYLNNQLNNLYKKNNIDEYKKMAIYKNYDILSDFMDNYEIIEDEKLLNMSSNHAITVALNKGKYYMLDPTNDTTFRPYRSDKQFFTSDLFNKVPVDWSFSLNNNSSLKKCRILKGMLQEYSFVSKVEEQMIKSNTINICNENLDIFEKFYNENKELYKEITGNMSKIKN